MKPEVRLYSTPPAVPADVVPPQHQDIHTDLERWGEWNRERRQIGHCRSVEHRYETGGRQVKPPQISLPINPRNQQIDRAVYRLPEQHRESVRLYYVIRWEPRRICKAMAIHRTAFPRWMFDCRAMVLNILRKLDA